MCTPRCWMAEPSSPGAAQYVTAALGRQTLLMQGPGCLSNDTAQHVLPLDSMPGSEVTGAHSRIGSACSLTCQPGRARPACSHRLQGASALTLLSMRL